jgi:starch synthase
VTRVTVQKVLLMVTRGRQSPELPLARILGDLGDDGVVFVLGSGDPILEQPLLDLTRQYSNFVFLKGYSDLAALLLYGAGDLFLMPSTFEPCGISQMLAMREGQPCVVNQVGGLKETVQDGVNGFSFTGTAPAELADNFAAKTHEALGLLRTNPGRYRQIREAARTARFSWSDSAKKYIEKLYL